MAGGTWVSQNKKIPGVYINVKSQPAVQANVGDKGIVAIAMGRELVPVLAGVVVAGRIGAAIAAELGTMKVTEQIDALRVMATSPVRYLVCPRVLAIALMMPVLIVFGNFIGNAGGYLVAHFYADISSFTYLNSIKTLSEPFDIFGGMIKGVVFGVIISIVGCYKGLHARQGAEGVGLGHAFLRHVERTRMLLHVLDIAGSEGRDPLEDYDAIMKELEAYGDLKDRPMIVVANKMDLPGAEENLQRLREKLAGTGIDIYPVSAATRQNFKALLYATVELLETCPPAEPFLEEELGDLEALGSGEPFAVETENGVYFVSGREMDRLMASVNFDNEDSLNWFHRSLRRLGVIDALRERGAKEGDSVVIGDMEFDFVE